MRHFPVYLDTAGQRIIVSGAGTCAVAKLRLLIKTEAELRVFGDAPDQQILTWQKDGRLEHLSLPLTKTDLDGALLLYAANDDAELDHAAARLGRDAGVKTLIVDNLDDSDFITPAIVDRDPVTIAIGTEGAAPVLARKLKAELEERLPPSLGTLARIGKAFRPMVRKLPFGRARREFWSRYYFDQGPKALEAGEWAVDQILNSLLIEMQNAPEKKGEVIFVGAGPGDPELLTLKARKALHEADVVLHDALVPGPILELARREATIIEVGKVGFGPSWSQDDINALLIEYGRESQVVRLKSGDSGIFGRLDEEIDALCTANIAHSVIPGITAAAAAAATLKVSLTRRGRNSELRLFTAHDIRGFSRQDWTELAKPGAVAGIYMGKAAAAHLRGRLLMHGGNPDTPVTVVANASRPEQKLIPANLISLPKTIENVAGPAVILLGLAPREAQRVALQEAQ